MSNAVEVAGMGPAGSAVSALGPADRGAVVPSPAPGAEPAGPPDAGRAAFADALAAAAGELRVSHHAQRRLAQRGLELDDDRARRLRHVLDQLAARGARSSLVWLDAVAYLVDVRGQRVVTAVPTSPGKEVLFTQIDSVALV